MSKCAYVELFETCLQENEWKHCDTTTSITKTTLSEVCSLTVLGADSYCAEFETEGDYVTHAKQHNGKRSKCVYGDLTLCAESSDEVDC